MINSLYQAEESNPLDVFGGYGPSSLTLCPGALLAAFPPLLVVAAPTTAILAAAVTATPQDGSA